MITAFAEKLQRRERSSKIKIKIKIKVTNTDEINALTELKLSQLTLSCLMLNTKHRLVSLIMFVSFQGEGTVTAMPEDKRMD